MTVSAAWADDLLTAREMVAESYGILAQQNIVTLHLSGDVIVGNDSTPFAAQMVVKRVPKASGEKIYFEGLVTEGAFPTHRYVGDSEHLWIYDVKKNTYSVVDYASAPTLPEQSARLFNTLKRVTSGPAQFLASFMSDIDRARSAGSTVVANTWNPYLGSATVTTSKLSIACNTRPPTFGNLTYAFQQTPDGIRVLTSATYETSKVIAGNIQKTSWTMMEFDELPSAVDFTFDKGNALPVSISVAQGGGGG